MSEAAQKIPPFPLASYRYPRDRLRHWAALQGDRVFSPTEILVGAGLLGAQSAIKDMVRAQELIRLGRGKLKVGKLHSIVDGDSEREQARCESNRRDEAWKALEREIDMSVAHYTRS